MHDLMEHLRNVKIQERLRLRIERVRAGGAFHNPYHMENAAQEFLEEAKVYSFEKADFDLMLNSAKYLSEVGLDNLPEYLSQQLVRPVDFVGSVKRLIGDDVTNFVEVGKKRDRAKYKVLSGLIRRDFEDVVHIIEVTELSNPTVQKIQ